MKITEYEVYDIADEYVDSCLRNGYYDINENIRYFRRVNRHQSRFEVDRICEEIRDIFKWREKCAEKYI